MDKSCLILQTGKTALMLAAMKNRLDEARVLVDAGADLDTQDQVSVATNLLCTLIHLSP